MRKFLIAAVAVAGLAFSSAAFAEHEKDSKDKGWNGVLIDKACGSKQKTEKDAAEHGKDCAMKPGCASSGYGLFVKDTWYKFDEKGQDVAKKYLKEEDHGTKVHVTGELDKDKKMITVKEIHPQDKDKDKDKDKDGDKKDEK
jgi:hypothetical protein